MNHHSATAASLFPIEEALPQALHDLGVGAETLTAQQCAALDRDGFLFLLLPQHMPETLHALCIDYDRLMRDKYADYGRPSPQHHSEGWNHEAGTRRLSDLASEGTSFDATYTDPVLLAAIWHLMRRPFH